MSHDFNREVTSLGLKLNQLEVSKDSVDLGLLRVTLICARSAEKVPLL